MRHYTLRQLQTFIEVANVGSVSKAAERLFITQPAVSMQLRQLEEAFGIALLEPAGRNIRLTQAGQDFLKHAISAMAQLGNLEAVVAEHVGVKKGLIQLAVVSTVKYFVPMLLVTFKKIYENIQVRLHIDNREAVLGLLERCEVDLVIMGTPPKNLDCVATAFATNPMGIVAAPSHPLSRSKRISFRTLGEHGFLVRETGSGTRAAIERLFDENRVTLQPVMEMPSNETIKQAVMADMGLGFLSLRTVRRELASGHLALLDVVDTPIKGSWYVVHMKQKRLSPAALAFKDFLNEQGGALIESWA